MSLSWYTIYKLMTHDNITFFLRSRRPNISWRTLGRRLDLLYLQPVLYYWGATTIWQVYLFGWHFHHYQPQRPRPLRTLACWSRRRRLHQMQVQSMRLIPCQLFLGQRLVGYGWAVWSCLQTLMVSDPVPPRMSQNLQRPLVHGRTLWWPKWIKSIYVIKFQVYAHHNMFLLNDSRW